MARTKAVVFVNCHLLFYHSLHYIGGTPKKNKTGVSSDTISTSSSISTRKLQLIVEDLKYQRHRKSTKSNYYGIWKKFNELFIRLDVKPNNWEDRIVLFVGYMINEGRKSTTIRSYVSAIKAILADINEQIDDNSVLLSSLTKACRIQKDTLTMKLPIKKGLLKLILVGITRLFNDPPQPYLEILYKVMFVTAYFGLFRIGELTLSDHNVRAKDVHVGINKTKLLFVLHSSKMHSKGVKPQMIKITASESSELPARLHQSTSTCPFRLVKNYIKHCKKCIQHNAEEPFFIFNDRSPVKPNNFRYILKKSLKIMGLDHTYYSSSGFRLVRACDLLEMGFSVETIRKIGRWKSTSVYTYLRT